MNNKKLVPAYLCIVLTVSNCAGGSSQRNENRPTSNIGSTQHAGPVGKASVDKPDPKQLMDAVKRAYSDLAFYSSRGVHTAREEFRGKRIENQEIPFSIEYSRGENAVVRWTEADHERAFKIEGKNSWLEVDGKRVRTFSTPDDGLEIGPVTMDHENLLGIRYFIFKDEMNLGDRVFAGLMDLESRGEEAVDGHPCHVLTGNISSVDARRTYWIDKDTSLIRRIENILVVRTRSEGKEYVSTTTTTENYMDIELRAGSPQA